MIVFLVWKKSSYAPTTNHQPIWRLQIEMSIKHPNMTNLKLIFYNVIKNIMNLYLKRYRTNLMFIFVKFNSLNTEYKFT
jgi:hypothetical protein